MTTDEMVSQLRDKERNPPDMAWRNVIADRLHAAQARITHLHSALDTVRYQSNRADLDDLALVALIGREEWE